MCKTLQNRIEELDQKRRDDLARSLGLRLLRDLPNTEGYDFIGVRYDLQHVDCFVTVDSRGLHTIDGEASYSQLIGWVRSH